MDIQQVIISNIKKWRKKAGLSQEKLAGLCGTAPAYIRQIEIGNRSPSIKCLVKIAGVLKIAPWQLLYEDNNEDNNENSNIEAIDSIKNIESNMELDFRERKTRVKKELITNLSKSISVNVKEAFEKL